MASGRPTKTAIITGASSGVYLLFKIFSFQGPKSNLGIGKASAIALSKAGWNVGLIARRVDKLHETESLCLGPGKLVLPGDVSDEEFIQESFRRVVSTFGEFDG